MALAAGKYIRDRIMMLDGLAQLFFESVAAIIGDLLKFIEGDNDSSLCRQLFGQLEDQPDIQAGRLPIERSIQAGCTADGVEAEGDGNAG